MQFAIANTFNDSLRDLDKPARNRAKKAVYDFQMNPDQPGFRFHRVDRAKHDHFWSARISGDLRMIIHHKGDMYTLCYVDRHDAAYDWAERRKVEPHPVTGSVQIVEVKERIEEIVQPIYKQTEPALFDDKDEQYLLRLGVPPEWVDPVRNVGETKLLEIVEHLPEEVGERLLRLADGEPVPVPKSRAPENPFEHPDSQRRFHIVENETELKQAMEWPWEKWIVFLHPRQRRALDKTYNGPAYVSGGAGTGKTVVAMHRAAQLLREYPDRKVLFTTFSKTLASRLQYGMDMLIGEDHPHQERLRITNLHKIAAQIWRQHHGDGFEIAKDKQVRDLLDRTAEQAGLTDVSPNFLYNEWDAIIDAWGIEDWETYRDFARKGRGTPLGARRRYELWQVFQAVQGNLERRGKTTWSRLFYDCIDIAEKRDSVRWNHIVVDEAQDFGPAELQLLHTLTREDVQNNLFLVGDSGQRIYKRYFNWSDVGIHVVGRSTRLKINYRTTEQIRQFADRLMPPDLKEHGKTSGGRDAISLLKGVAPDVHGFDSVDDEIEFVAQKLVDLREQGYAPRDIATFGRLNEEILQDRAERAASLADVPYEHLSNNAPEPPDALALGTLHNAKGLEFKTVIIMGCEADYVPLSWALEDIPDDADRDDVYEQERNLLYVAATRAREKLVVTYAGEGSPFLG